MFGFKRMIASVALLLSLTAICAEEDKSNNEATEAAEAYRQLFDEIESFQNDLGDSYDAILSPEDHTDVVVSEADRVKFEQHLDAQLAQLSTLAQQSKVNWGYKEELMEKGPMATFPQFNPIRHLVKSAVWHAEEHWDEAPDKATDHLLNAMALARQQNQETFLLSHLIQNACDNMVVNSLGELAPKMSEAQRDQILQRMDQLPTSGTLAGAISAESNYISGWFLRTINEELETWESENSGIHGYRFPEDLQLAGIALLSNKPARISLHNTQNGDTFWLEQGQTINGILLEKVDRGASRAWIRLGTESAVINLRKSTITRRSVPIEVLHKVLVRCGYATGKESIFEIMLELVELGMHPDTILTQLESMQAHYSEVIRRIDDPIDEFKEWEDATIESYGENSFIGTSIPKFSKILELDRAYKRKTEALKYAFALMNDSPADSINSTYSSENFEYTETENGFAITPVEYIEHEKKEQYTVHIGKQPENED